MSDIVAKNTVFMIPVSSTSFRPVDVIRPYAVVYRHYHGEKSSDMRTFSNLTDASIARLAKIMLHINPVHVFYSNTDNASELEVPPFISFQFRHHLRYDRHDE